MSSVAGDPNLVGLGEQPATPSDHPPAHRATPDEPDPDQSDYFRRTRPVAGWLSRQRDDLIRDALVAGVVGGLVGLLLFWGAATIDDKRADRQDALAAAQADRAEILENLRFVRTAMMSPDIKSLPFAELNLRGADLAGLPLGCPDIVQPDDPDLGCANLSSANLSGANLSEANLAGANLKNADLTGANLRDADLTGAWLEGSNLREANLEYADLAGAHLGNADLSGAKLENANLTSAKLEGANLSGANLSSTFLGGANLTDAKLTGADLSFAQLKGAKLTQADITAADLSTADLTDTDLADADLTDANLSFAQLNQANLTATNLTRCDLTAADLTGADLTGAILTETNLTETTLNHATGIPCSDSNRTWPQGIGIQLTTPCETPRHPPSPGSNTRQRTDPTTPTNTSSGTPTP